MSVASEIVRLGAATERQLCELRELSRELVRMGAGDLAALVEDARLRLVREDLSPDPDEHGMAFALACCGSVPPAKVRAILIGGDESALNDSEGDELHGWLSALLFARGEPEDDEQIAMWVAGLEGA